MLKLTQNNYQSLVVESNIMDDDSMDEDEYRDWMQQHFKDLDIGMDDQ